MWVSHAFTHRRRTFFLQVASGLISWGCTWESTQQRQQIKNLFSHDKARCQNKCITRRELFKLKIPILLFFLLDFIHYPDALLLPNTKYIMKAFCLQATTLQLHWQVVLSVEDAHEKAHSKDNRLKTLFTWKLPKQMHD